MKIYNLGSLNIDYVYSVEHFVTAGETLPSDVMEVFPGGKGLNIFIQSEGLVCHRRQANVIRLHSKRYVIKSQDLYVPFLLIDYIPPAADYMQHFALIIYTTFGMISTENACIHTVDMVR